MSDKTGVVEYNEDAFIAARGMATKLLDVAGTRAIPGADNCFQELGPNQNVAYGAIGSVIAYALIVCTKRGDK